MTDALERAIADGGIVDCYVNAHSADLGTDMPSLTNFFKENAGGHRTADELIEDMDASRIAWALLTPPPENQHAVADQEIPYRWAVDAVERHPDRFRLAVRVNPYDGMKAVRQLESMVRNDGAAALRLAPYRVGRPCTDKIFYPLYTKCCELGIPVTILTGIMTNWSGSRNQHPILFDELCEQWPELVVVSAHGAQPWGRELVQLMRNFKNLYHTISGFVPERYPPELIEFANSRRGRHKILFSTDWPAVDFARAVNSLHKVPIDDDVWPYFLRDNSNRVFGAPGQGPPG
ncbi:MAG TPA: amidohydrolase family protein [Solirubrobacteraceae bacterium]